MKVLFGWSLLFAFPVWLFGPPIPAAIAFGYMFLCGSAIVISAMRDADV